MSHGTFLYHEPRGIVAEVGQYRPVNGELAFWHSQLGGNTDTEIRMNGCPMSLPVVVMDHVRAKGIKRIYVQGRHDDGQVWAIDLDTVLNTAPTHFGREMQFIPERKLWTKTPRSAVSTERFDDQTAEKIHIDVPDGTVMKRR